MTLLILDPHTGDFNLWVPSDTPASGPALLKVDLTDKTAVEEFMDYLDHTMERK